LKQVKKVQDTVCTQYQDIIGSGIQAFPYTLYFSKVEAKGKKMEKVKSTKDSVV
jgi:hypothetical protein